MNLLTTMTDDMTSHDDMNSQMENNKTPISEANPPNPPNSNPQALNNSNGASIDAQTLHTLIQQNTNLIQSMTSLVQTLSLDRKPKVIPPGKFRFNSGETLIQFFSRFEAYSAAMYPGSTDGMVPLLGSHLDGTALEVYKIISHTSMEYEEVKQRMLQWFREELEKEFKVDAENFTEAVLKENEAIPLFALRLVGLAQRAFPGNDVTKMPIVRQKFLKSLPNEVKQQVDNTLMAIETSLGLQIPWERLVAIVDSSFSNKVQQEKGATSGAIPDLMNPGPTFPKVGEISLRTCCCHQLTAERGSCSGRQSAVQAQMPAQNVQPQQTVRMQNPPYQSHNTYVNGGRRSASTWSRGTSNRRSNNNYSQSCAHCKKTGHSMSQCRARPLCRYCGRRGHLYEDCYLVQNRCLHCKELGHLVANCPIRNNDQLECPFCEGDHLGKDCPQRQESRPQRQENRSQEQENC